MGRTKGVPIWITGLGVASAAGWSLTETWDAVVAGRSAVTRLRRFPLGDIETRVGAVLPGYERIEPATPSIALEAGLAALAEATRDAALDPVDSRAGMVVVANHGERRTPADGLPGTVIGASELSHHIARAAGCASSLTVYGACAGGTLAVGTALQILRQGRTDLVVAGGTDCLLRDVDFFQFAGLYAMSSRPCPPYEASCPFDLRRDGFVLADGAGFLVLETATRAEARGARPRAVLEGFGSAQTAHHMVSSPPDGRGPAEAMRAALDDAGIGVADVDYVNAHGTATQDNDVCETAAAHRVFGERAPHIPFSSTKSQLGHSMGAAGAIEAAVCVRALEEGVVPPTSNLQVADPRCDLDYVPGEARPARLRHVVSNGLGFGGHCGCLVLGAA